MTRSRCDSLGLHRMKLSFTTPHRLRPAHATLFRFPGRVRWYSCGPFFKPAKPSRYPFHLIPNNRPALCRGKIGPQEYHRTLQG
jgi:hypothetical protein